MKTHPDRTPWIKLITACMVFTGAFLSFSLEPIVGRLITPFFGGSAHLWTVSLMVFQALLLLAYLYAHLLAKRFRQWHLLILLLPLLQWPLNFESEVAPKAPTLTLIIELLLQVSLPFAVLCTTAVVAQSWWYQSRNPATQSPPYFLYAVSNWGAMVALFAYPFVLEPLLGLAAQRWLWSFAYLAYAMLTVWVWFVLNGQPRVEAYALDADAPIAPVSTSLSSSASNSAPQFGIESAPAYPFSTVLRWLALSAAPSALLLACTNVISMEVGAFPLVWIFPLALYLGAFTWAFSDSAHVLTAIFQKYVLEIGLVALLCSRLLASYIGLIPLLLLVFFLLCLVAHRELYRLRPHPSQLTQYYLWIALGGWIGGLLVSLLAPVVFSGLWEYPLAVLAILLLCWPQAWMQWWKNAPRGFGYTRLTFLIMCFTLLALNLSGPASLFSLRNFYGIHTISEKPASDNSLAHRQLLHGQTIHGMQHIDGDRVNEPLAYYYPGGAMAEAMGVRNRNEPSAIVGLGAGSALVWFDKGEKVTAYEIDPDVEDIAKNWFGFFAASKASVRFSIGDARLNLRTDQSSGAYGAMLVDAFSGDGIPVHLLTLEALDVYLSRLSNDGILVFHVSNRYYDLIPVLKAAAAARGLSVITNTPNSKTAYPLHIDPKVVVMARSEKRLSELLTRPHWWRLEGARDIAVFEPWTDDYVSVLGALWSRLGQVKHSAVGE
jgi:spermidine synthase